MNEVEKFIKQVMQIKDYDLHTEIAGVVMGNKVDLESKQKVSTEEGCVFAEQFNLHYFETSMKT